MGEKASAVSAEHRFTQGGSSPSLGMDLAPDMALKSQNDLAWKGLKAHLIPALATRPGSHV